MKLYVWRPDGHGELTFFSVAESEESARRKIEIYIEAGKKKDWLEDGHIRDIDVSGWGTDYYSLEEYAVGEVAVNSND